MGTNRQTDGQLSKRTKRKHEKTIQAPMQAHMCIWNINQFFFCTHFIILETTTKHPNPINNPRNCYWDFLWDAHCTALGIHNTLCVCVCVCKSFPGYIHVAWFSRFWNLEVGSFLLIGNSACRKNWKGNERKGKERKEEKRSERGEKLTNGRQYLDAFMYIPYMHHNGSPLERDQQEDEEEEDEENEARPE